MAHEVTDFASEVIEQSRSIPVLVDFWAPWCGPCRVLGPVLERLAETSNGRWVLAKLNTDENPEVSMRYGIRGIPAVKLFVDGEVQAEFMGALPEHAVRKWLDENVPSAERSSVEQAAQLLAAGDYASARQMLEGVETDGARILLARLIVFEDPDRALSLLQSVEANGGEMRATVESVREVASALRMDVNGLPDGPGKESFASVLSALRTLQLDSAADGIVSVLKLDRYYGDDAARKLGIALFTLLGPEHPVTRKHRRMFDMYLF